MTYSPPPNGWRTFLIVWVTQSISVFGSALTYFAINIWLTQTLYPAPEQKEALAWALSAVALAFALPTVFGAPIAGAWADRHDRKRTMIMADIGSGLLSLVVVGLVLANAMQLWMLIGLVVLFALFSAFHSAAFDTCYAMLVPEEKLPRANGLMQTIWALSGILSPPLAAILIALPAMARQGVLPGPVAGLLASFSDGAALAITVDAISFFVAAAVLLFLHIPSPTRTDLSPDASGRRKSLWADVREGAAFIWRRRPLLWLLATFTVANFTGAPLGVFQPLLVKFNFAADWAARGYTFETALALLGSIGGIGGLVGGFAISSWGGLKRRRVYGILVPMIASALAMIVLGMTGLLFAAGAMIFVYNATIPFMNAHSQTIWQTQTPHELQGRVFAVRRVIAQFTWPLGTALAGLLGGRFDPGLVIAALGLIFLVFTAAQFFNPILLRVEDKGWLDGMAVPTTAEA